MLFSRLTIGRLVLRARKLAAFFLAPRQNIKVSMGCFDFFSDRNAPHVVTLQELIENEEDLSLCGVVLAEVLQGIRFDTDVIKTKEYLGDLIFLPMRQATFLRSAEIYRSLRKQGITIRKPVDCMIASVAIEHEFSITGIAGGLS